jgi:GTPase SAR1 family protein
MKDPTNTNIRVAVFGESGSGKTTLLSAFFGKQQSETFATGNKYYFSADNKGQGNSLLSNYYGLEEGHFPSATFGYEDYNFSVFIPDLKQKKSELKVTWIDYPGKWWTQEERDSDAKKIQQTCFESLMSAQVGILLVDAARLKEENEKYLRKLFEQFRNEFKRIERESLQEGRPAPIGPETWIIALNKADLFPNMDALSFSKMVIRSAGQQFQDIAKQLRCNNFGCKYLLLASVKTKPTGEIEDPNSTIGIDCIAPAALVSALEEFQNVLRKRAADKSWREKWIESMKNILSFVDSLDDFLPPKYQIITQIIRELGIADMLDQKIEVIRSRRDDYIKKENVLGATISSMLSTFQASKEKGVYTECQK